MGVDMKKVLCIALAAMALLTTGLSSRDAFCAGPGGGGHGGGGYGGHGGGSYGGYGGGSYGWHGGYGGHGGYGWYGGHGGYGWYGGHGSNVGVDLWIGPGWGPGWWGPYYPYYYPYYPYYPYYATPPVVVEEQEPQTYIQLPPKAKEPSYWYFCNDPKGYYPYVKKCPKGWQKVVPSPAPEEEEE